MSGGAPPAADADDGAAVTLALEPAIPAEVAVGAPLAFKVRASCAAGHDLAGALIEALMGDAVMATRRLVSLPDGASETDTLVLTAPAQPAAVTWTVRFPAQEIAGIVVSACALPVTFTTVPLRTSLALWDVPSPIAAGQPFRVKVGAKSAASHPLAGACFEIVDERGTAVGRGKLGDAPWPETDALYWSEIELAAPAAAGTYSWSVAFAPVGQALPHGGSSTRLGFTVVPPPEARLNIRVTDQTEGAPIADVQVALGPYRAATDATGTAVIEAPRGNYQLALWKALFEAAEMRIDLAADAIVALALKRLPEEVKIWG